MRRNISYPSNHNITIAVMGCRVNGPGETDDAVFGLWCDPATEAEAGARRVDRGQYRAGSIKEALSQLSVA